MRRVFICTCLTHAAKMTLFTELEPFFEELPSLPSQAERQLLAY